MGSFDGAVCLSGRVHGDDLVNRDTRHKFVHFHFHSLQKRGPWPEKIPPPDPHLAFALAVTMYAGQHDAALLF